MAMQVATTCLLLCKIITFIQQSDFVGLCPARVKPTTYAMSKPKSFLYKHIIIIIIKGSTK